MYLYEKFILWEKRMNKGVPYLQMWRGARVNCHSFLSYPLDIDLTTYIAGW